jgi:dTDP-glucose pyrophosphorylase
MGIHESLKTVVVLCAGESSRFSGGGGKWYAKALGRPVLSYAISPFKDFCERWIFVVSRGDKNIRKFIEDEGLSADIVVQTGKRGISDAVMLAAERAGTPFTVVLGDCIFAGHFDFEVKAECGIGVLRGGSGYEVADNFGVVVENGLAVKAVEKPAAPGGMFCGMGAYFISDEMMRHFRDIFARSGGRIHITDMIQSWMERGGGPAAVWFDGVYVNVNTMDDLLKVEKMLKDAGDQTRI